MAGVIMVDLKMKGGWGYYGRLWDERWLGLLGQTLRCKVAGDIMVDCEMI